MQLDLEEAITAQEARDRAIESHKKRAAGAVWIERAKLHARAIATEKGSVTIDDVRDSIGAPPKECDARINGAVFSSRKEWECIGYEQSKRKECHRRPIGRFVLREAA